MGSIYEVEKEKPLLGGADLIKELPLMRFEPIILLVTTFGGFFLIVLDTLGALPEGSRTAFYAVTAITWALWFLKWTLFLPRGKKMLFAKFFRNSGVQIYADVKPKDDMIKFDKKDEVPPVQLGRTNKHFEINSGRPFVVCVEGVPKNISVIDDNEPDKTAKEYDNILKTTWSTGFLTGLSKASKLQGFFNNPTNIITLIMLLCIIGTLYLLFTQQESLAMMTDTLNQIKDIVQAQAAMPQ